MNNKKTSPYLFDGIKRIRINNHSALTRYQIPKDEVKRMYVVLKQVMEDKAPKSYDEFVNKFTLAVRNGRVDKYGNVNFTSGLGYSVYWDIFGNSSKEQYIPQAFSHFDYLINHNKELKDYQIKDANTKHTYKELIEIFNDKLNHIDIDKDKQKSSQNKELDEEELDEY